MGSRARVRRHGPRVAARRGRRGRPLAPGPRRARAHRLSTGRSLIIICTPNNPTGARLTAAGARRDRAHRRSARRLDPVGRDLSRRRARWPRVGVDVGPLRRASSSPAVCRKRTGCPGCASAGSSRRRRSSPRPGRTTTTSTIAPGALSDRAGAGGARRRRGGRRCSSARAASCAPTCRSSSMAARARSPASPGSGPKPARSSTCATTTGSTRPSWSPGCATRTAC